MKLNKWLATITVISGLIGLLTGAGCRTVQPCPAPRVKPLHPATAGQIAPPLSAGLNPLDFSRPLTLEDAIAVALRANPDHAMAWHRIRQSQAMIDQSNASFYPVFGVYTEYSQGDSPSAYLFKKIDQRMLPEQVDFNDPGWFENFEIGVISRFNIYNGGRDVMNLNMAHRKGNIAQADRQAVENVLVASVIDSYYDVLSAEEFIRIARESVSTVQSQLELMTVRFSAGGALKSDILSLQVRLAQTREDVLRSQNRYETAVAVLATLLGTDPDQPITLIQSPIFSPDLPQTYPEGLNYALSHRPELIKLKEQILQSETAVAIAKSGYLPRVDVEARYYMGDPDMNFDTRRDNWTLGVMLNWDLFTGLSTPADIRKTAALLDEMKEADRKMLLAVALDVKRSYLKLSEAHKRYSVALESVADAEESLRLVKHQYEGGSATITRYLEAELDRNRARVRSTAAFYDRQKAVSEIGKSIGYWVSSDLYENPGTED